MNMEHQPMFEINNIPITHQTVCHMITAIDFEVDETPLLGEITLLSATNIHNMRYLYPEQLTENIQKLYTIEGYGTITSDINKPFSDLSIQQKKVLFDMCGFIAKMLQKFNWPIKAGRIHLELITGYWNFLHNTNEFNHMWIDLTKDVQGFFENYFNNVTRAAIIVRK